ncbi:restriction endonuclease [Natronosalvus vescus]|uniref:restriction endonuclease n=1 Tax=Natronosalvus vescus TaxID=2953881 RepID=UPI002091DD74|nr:restriction endonuclease [Natronosalvus vescus]
MSPYEFERLVGNLWSEMGYDTEVVKGSGDRGIDVIASKEDPFKRTQLIQTKKYSHGNKIGSQKIREYRTLYDQEESVNTVAIVTTGNYTRQARKLAEDLDVETVNGLELVKLLKSEGKSLLEDLFPSETATEAGTSNDSKTKPKKTPAEPEPNSSISMKHINPERTESVSKIWSDDIEKAAKEFDDQR